MSYIEIMNGSMEAQSGGLQMLARLCIVIITFCVVVSCFNVQAMRDTLAPEPDAIETIIVNTLTKEGDNGSRTADQS